VGRRRSRTGRSERRSSSRGFPSWDFPSRDVPSRGEDSRCPRVARDPCAPARGERTSRTGPAQLIPTWIPTTRWCCGSVRAPARLRAPVRLRAPARVQGQTPFGAPGEIPLPAEVRGPAEGHSRGVIRAQVAGRPWRPPSAPTPRCPAPHRPGRAQPFPEAAWRGPILPAGRRSSGVPLPGRPWDQPPRGSSSWPAARPGPAAGRRPVAPGPGTPGRACADRRTPSG